MNFYIISINTKKKEGNKNTFLIRGNYFQKSGGQKKLLIKCCWENGGREWQILLCTIDGRDDKHSMRDVNRISIQCDVAFVWLHQFNAMCFCVWIL